MVYVKKQPGDTDDAIIRKFSRKVIDAGIVNEAKRRQFYLKPSLAKKLKAEEPEVTSAVVEEQEPRYINGVVNVKGLRIFLQIPDS